MNSGYISLLAPEDKDSSCGLGAVSHSVDVAQILFHHRCCAEVLELKTQLLELVSSFAGKVLLVAQQ